MPDALPNLSVAVVCRNNEATIGRTLESVAGLAAEVVAVDSGSTDGTIALLEHYGARIVHSEWLGHVRTKQRALDACSLDWTLCLDSDESLEPDLRAALAAFLPHAPPGVAGARVNRKVWYLGGFLEHVWQPEWRLRLVRRGCARWGGLDPHDKLELLPADPHAPTASLRAAERRVVDLPGTLRHDSFTTIGEHLGKQVAHARVAAASLAATGQRGRIVDLVCSPIGAFLKQIVVKSGWRDGPRGWVAAASAAAGTLMKHAILIESTLVRSETAQMTRIATGPADPRRTDRR